jgi:hypothetical protein
MLIVTETTNAPFVPTLVNALLYSRSRSTQLISCACPLRRPRCLALPQKTGARSCGTRSPEAVSARLETSRLRWGASAGQGRTPRRGRVRKCYSDGASPGCESPVWRGFRRKAAGRPRGPAPDAPVASVRSVPTGGSSLARLGPDGVCASLAAWLMRLLGRSTSTPGLGLPGDALIKGLT